ncbi:MAG: protein translocase subunit SecF, partial [Phycisphaerae bacterium]
FSTILDANLTTLLTCIILGFVGSEEIKGFAITLGIGISTSMFTSLFVTRLVFNTLIAKGWLNDLSMRRIIGVPTVDWLALRRTFWPVSIAAVVSGLTLFVWMSTTRTETMYDIEFLGGTSLQIDLKPGHTMPDEAMMAAVPGPAPPSGVSWLESAADHRRAANAADGEVPGQFTLVSDALTGEQLRSLTHLILQDKLVRDGIQVEGHTARYDGRPGQLSLDTFKQAVADAAQYAEDAADRLRSGRVQSVGGGAAEGTGASFEIVTVETDRQMVQAAVMATLGDKLAVQRAISFRTLHDEQLTKEPFFVVESGDHYLSDVIGGDGPFDVRRFRGGLAIVVELDAAEPPLPMAVLERRLREVGLQPEFEDLRTRDTAVFPVGKATTVDGEPGYRRFAVLAVDESLLYEDDPVQWTESLARKQLALVEAALGQEKSLSKVIQFAAPIAGQTRQRTVMAIVLALGAIVSYLWLRFGNKDYGLAAIAALVHDVAVTLGLVTLTQFVYATFVGKALLIDSALRIDLPMIAAILTVIGYSLNDTIVVFDRIRENKGRVETLNPRIINTSINQTLARTLLTSMTTFLVVAVLYVFGGTGVHGFSFALLSGVVVGTYSSIGVATPLLHRPVLLHSVVAVLVATGVLGVIVAVFPGATIRLVLVGLTLVLLGAGLRRIQRGPRYAAGARTAPA